MGADVGSYHYNATIGGSSGSGRFRVAQPACIIPWQYKLPADRVHCIQSSKHNAGNDVPAATAGQWAPKPRADAGQYTAATAAPAAAGAGSCCTSGLNCHGPAGDAEYDLRGTVIMIMLMMMMMTTHSRI